MVIKKRYLTFFSILFFFQQLVSMNLNPIHINGVLNENAKAIFSTLGESLETVKAATEYAQNHLLRTGERWDKQKDTPVLVECKKNKGAIIARLIKLGMVDEVRPHKKDFMYALCMGATIYRVRKRLNYISKLQKDGYTFDHIVLLSGERPLNEDEKEFLPPEITTEAEMMQYVYDKHPNIKKSKAILVNASMVLLPTGEYRRPNTDDTLYYFAKIAPKEGSVLAVSDNPYIYRQTKAAQRILQEKGFEVYGAGAAFNPEHISMNIIMDEFARALYEEYRQTCSS